MIWPFRPHPPLPLAHKVACERRFAAVGKLLGRQRIPATTVVAPQDMEAFIADCEPDVLPRRLFDFFAARMPPLPNPSVEVSWGSADELTVDGQAQSVQVTTNDEGQTAIHIHPLFAEFPYRLAAVTAAAAAELLMRSDSTPPNIPAGTFELLPLYFGFGPIMANAGLHEVDEHSDGPQISRAGNVTPLEFGYSMALADWSLGMGHEQVKSLLRLDAKEGLENGLRFLRKTSDCSIPQDFLDHEAEDSVSSLQARLRDRSSSIQLATVMDLSAADAIDKDLISPIAELLRHRETDIQQLAATTLGRCSTLPPAIHDELVILAEHGPIGIRRAAAIALRPGYIHDDSVLEMLTDVLGRGETPMATACIYTLLKYESHPERLRDSLLRALSGMVLKLRTEDLQLGLQLLERIHEDPSQALREHFADDPTALAIFDEILHPGVELPDNNELH